jgi:hypothetical protein
MPVMIRRTVLIKDKEGKITQLTETDQVSEETEVNVTCDSQRCGSRNTDGKPTVVAWNSEEVKADPTGAPDAFFRLITLIPDSANQKQLVFCSAGCAKDYLTYEYVKPLSPREAAIIQVTNQTADAAKGRLPVNIVKFPAKDPAPAPVPTTEEISAGMATLEQVESPVAEANLTPYPVAVPALEPIPEPAPAADLGPEIPEAPSTDFIPDDDLPF